MTLFAQALTGAMVEFVWQGGVFALLIWLVLLLLRNSSARSRYLVSCTGLAWMAALPAIGTHHLYRIQPPPETSYFALELNWALPLWASGVVLLAVRHIWGLLRLSILHRTGTDAPIPLRDLAASVAVRMKCTRALRVLISASSFGPCVIGWLRPVIFLPIAGIAGLTPDQLEAVLAHEIAHIRRYDYVVNLFQLVVETLLFYHPAVWWISSRIREERELCCDDDVVGLLGDSLGYARALITLERLRPDTRRLAMSSTGGSLSYRIERLLGRAATPSEKWPAIAFAVLALLAIGACVNITRTADAQDKVTVEITHDSQNGLSDVRVVSGPAYLRPIAIQAAMESVGPNTWPVENEPDQHRYPAALRPNPKVVQRLTYPEAFASSAAQRGLLADFFGDEADQAEKTLKKITGNSPEDRRGRDRAIAIRADAQRKAMMLIPSPTGEEVESSGSTSAAWRIS